MSDYQPAPDDGGVERREETTLTNQPGYATTEQVTHDMGAERRQGVFQITRIIWLVLGLLEVLLAVRFLLKLIGANPASGFAVFIYGLTGLFTAPFTNLLATWSSGDTVFEVTTLVAMLIYALLFWGVARVIPIVLDRTTTRTVTRTTHQQTPGGTGNEHTTRTTSRD